MTTINPTERQSTFQRLGVRVDGMTIPDAMSHAGIDFTVGKMPLTAVITPPDVWPIEDHLVDFPGYSVTYRTDNLKPIAPVGNRYHVVQTVEATNLIESMLGGGWEPVFAGLVKKGRAVFMAGRIPFSSPTNEIDPYLCFVNSFDGSSGLKFACTPYRPACTNQIRAIFSRHNVRPVVSLRHTSNIMARAEQARELLGLSAGYYRYLDEQIERLLDLPLTDEIVDKALDIVAPLKPGEPDFVHERRMEKRETLVHNLKTSTTLASGIRSTGWGLYNALTEIEQWSGESTTAKVEAQLGSHVGITPVTFKSDRVLTMLRNESDLRRSALV